MANSVEDAALLLDVMSGHDPLDSTSSMTPRANAFKATQVQPQWSQIRVGVPKEYFVGGMDSAVEKSIQTSLKWFESKGAKLIPISLPHTQYAVAVYYIVAVSEASSNLARFDGVRFGGRPSKTAEAKDLTDFYKSVRSNFGPEVKRRIILGTFALSSGYADAYYKKACQVRRLIQQDFDHAFKNVDLIAGPVSPTTAFRLGEKSSDPLQMYLNDILTIPVNLAGLPAMSLPCGQDSQGLSVGLQLIAPHYSEERMISVAQAFSTDFEMGKV
jgi:aspartyl-tRNA(Asn)/glutamyl-tRNA(Gln) amidotransferase subunit A